ncbi:GumC family protein [Rhodobacter sp. TJ_12]|uniref:GumC family protein n=1 Tax=Rhodobacter sp. TJ_12 TaxID=2029399 RepID=UPI001CBCB7CD|nr:polysaccharide biosynthesis tyrosine autokinase [Rhodobacter sp. TJ_12]
MQKASQPAEEDIIDLRQIVAVLRADWKVIVGAVFGAVIIALIYALFLATPIYTATSVVVLDTRKPKVVDLEGMMGDFTGESAELNTEVGVLRSRGLAEKAVDALNLMEDPEFNPTLLPPSFTQRVFSALLPAGEDMEPDPRRIHAAVVSNLLSSISVANVSSSYIFEISVQSEDPEKAALIADKMADLYILSQIETKFEATEQATEWLANRVVELKSELEAAEEKVKAFNAQTTLISPESLTAMEVGLKDLRERREQLAAELTAARARYARLQDAQSPQEKRMAAQDPQLSQIPQTDPDRFAQRYAQIIANANLELARLEDQQAALDASIENMTAQIASQGEDMITLQQLTREAEASRALYEYFLARLKETSAQQGIQQADSRILSSAVIPGAPTAPRKGLILVVALILGLFAGGGFVLVRDALNNGMRTARQLEEETGISVMGQIPSIPAARRQEVLGYMASKPTSMVMEAFRNLRTSVLLSNVDAPPQVIVITSSVPDEGKTTNALGLAINLVGTGKSVLLVEGDIRRNMLGQYFPEAAENKKGLVSVLSGRATLDEVLVQDPQLGVTKIIGETCPVNAADLFLSEAYRHLMEEIRQRFDYIIIDTPPVLVVPDARIIAQQADAVLFTVRWNDTSRSQVQDALQMFETVNQKVSGLILSQVDMQKAQRYGYGGKYGAYAMRYYTN